MKTKTNDLAGVRWSMIVERGGNAALCDCCQKNRATELHHIITKFATMSNPDARKASECKELMALLCADCHTGAADNAHDEERFTADLARNCRRYGWQQVQEKYQAVQGLMFRQLPPFPQEEK